MVRRGIYDYAMNEDIEFGLVAMLLLCLSSCRGGYSAVC